MKCGLCDGKGKIKIERFGRENILSCYICEGVGEVEQCSKCNGAGENIIKVDDVFDFTACLICMGHGLIPKAQECDCNGKGYIWVQVGYDEPEWERDECNCYKGCE